MHSKALIVAFVMAGVAVTAQAPQQETPLPAPGSSEIQVDASPNFNDWLTALIREAQTRGYSENLVSETLQGLTPLEHVIQSDRSQAELNPGFDRYLSARLTPPLVKRGKELLVENRSLLRRIEKTYNVQGRFLLAIWAMETRYGRITGRVPVFQALATLAWEPRRASYFRGELFDALTMVQRGNIDAKTMTSSWAGAMGQTQFMPSSYLKYAVDFDGDDRRDIWGSIPDTLASIANYLKGFGWTRDQTWGREVKVTAAVRSRIDRTVPKRTEGCYALRNMTIRRPLSDWQRLGVRSLNGRALPKSERSAALVDVGTRKFLVYPNYDAILGYNCAHYYALTVALISDRLQ
ncbi:MAG TPA: lytic murein transglycosylase [Vicinamibacterales bacterium]|jgi:membrane-bound lytic murein transglycosylase B